jgi:polyisoprenoid-binding protein YceI
MNKFILPALLMATIMTSCGSDAVEATDAKEVKEVAITATYSTLGDHNHVDWQAWHVGKTGERSGSITIMSAEASVNEGMLAGGTWVLDMKSVTVTNFKGDETPKNAKLQGHLMSEAFFLTDSFPTSTFEITSSMDTMIGESNTMISGNLTMKGVTKNISFPAKVEISETGVSITSGTFEINRTDWGLSYLAAGMEGVLADQVIDNEIAFTIHANVTK